MFAVSLNTKGITANGSIADTTGVLSNFMKTVGFDIPEYKEGTPSGDYCWLAPLNLLNGEVV